MYALFNILVPLPGLEEPPSMLIDRLDEFKATLYCVDYFENNPFEDKERASEVMQTASMALLRGVAHQEKTASPADDG